MHKISVVTITCRDNPRLADVGRTIAAALARAPDVELQWLIVDEKARSVIDILGLSSGTMEENSERNAAYAAVDGRIFVECFSPPPTPWRSGSDKAVAHNTARNAGLVRANGDYVVFLNDCNIVTMDWALVARDCSVAGLGWRCKTDTLHDMAVPANGVVKHRGHHDLLNPVPPMTASGACWGAPMAAFKKIHGFDISYDGQRRGNDIDAVVRLSRVGIKFVTTERAFTIQLRRTKIDTEVTQRKDVYVGARNQTTLNQLLRDKQRFLPLVEDPTFGARPYLVVEEPESEPESPPPVPRFARGGDHTPKMNDRDRNYAGIFAPFDNNGPSGDGGGGIPVENGRSPADGDALLDELDD